LLKLKKYTQLKSHCTIPQWGVSLGCSYFPV